MLNEVDTDFIEELKSLVDHSIIIPNFNFWRDQFKYRQNIMLVFDVSNCEYTIDIVIDERSEIRVYIADGATPINPLDVKLPEEFLKFILSNLDKIKMDTE